MADDPLSAALAEVRGRLERARYPEDDGGRLYIAAAAVAVALGEAPGWTVRRSGVSAEVYEGGRGVPAWRVWVERGKDGHLIGNGEFGRSARDVPRLLAAVEAVLEEHDQVPSVRLEPCTEHKHWRGPLVGDNDNLTVRRACPACQVFDEPYCRTCVDDEGRFRDWPCPTVKAITSALLGEEAPGAQA